MIIWMRVLFKAEHCNWFCLSYLVSYLVFINHNQNPEKESVKITVGRLLVVSGLAPLSQREGALMPSPGLGSQHIWPIRGKLGGPGDQWEDMESWSAHPWLWRSQGRTMMEVKKRVGYLRSYICNTFVLLSQIAWKATIIIILFSF